MSDNNSLTPEEVAAILKIKKHTVYQLVKRGELPAFRVGRKLRINPQDIEAYRRGNNVWGAPVTSSATASRKSTVQIIGNNQLVICGLDTILDVLARRVETVSPIRIYRKHENSFSGLWSLYNGQAHIAAIHLWDGDSERYNVPYIARMMPGIPVVLIHLAYRQQGFYVARGNPLKIESWSDLTRNEVRFVNREPGCGTRVFLDEKLRKLGISHDSVNGYDQIENYHLAVASAVARGLADVGLGCEKGALNVRGVDFLPLQKEAYEIVIRQADLSLPAIQKVIDIINSDSFKNEVLGLGDYDLSLTGQITAQV